jgi:osmotically-inducible protein OsmY
MKIERGRIAILLLTASLWTACAGTIPTPRSSAHTGPWSRGEDRVEDANLAADIHMALLDKLGQDALDIRVDVDGSRARLSGLVDQRSTMELAEEVARSVPGIAAVDNDVTLRVRPADTPVGHAVEHAEREVDDAVLELRVGKNLLGEIGRYALDLEVEASDGVVSVRGRLPDAERRKLALDAARKTPGVKRLIDLVTIGP